VTADLVAQAHELVERTCSEQGVAVLVTDDRTLDRVAAIVRSAKSAPPSTPGTADGGARSTESEPTASAQKPRRGSPSGSLGAAPSERRAS
jgi:hypothetical protein